MLENSLADNVASIPRKKAIGGRSLRFNLFVVRDQMDQSAREWSTAVAENCKPKYPEEVVSIVAKIDFARIKARLSFVLWERLSC